MNAIAAQTSSEARDTRLDIAALMQPAVLIFNPNAGQKLGLRTNSGGAEAALDALEAARIPFDRWPTERADHATELAHRAVAEGRELVIAAGGDGTVSEVAQALAGTDTILGVMPLGSIMNVARTLCIPRDLDEAAQTIANGHVVTMDLGRTEGVYFLEAAGVGLDAGLFGYFEKLDSRGMRWGVIRAIVRFLRQIGIPRLTIEIDGRVRHVRAPMVSVANGPFVGAAYTIAPSARLDDGLLHVIVFGEATVLRMLCHLACIAGGRRWGLPAGTTVFTGRSVQIHHRDKRPLPVHADGVTVGSTPAEFEAVHGALRVIVGEPEPNEICAWDRVRAQRAQS